MLQLLVCSFSRLSDRSLFIVRVLVSIVCSLDMLQLLMCVALPSPPPQPLFFLFLFPFPSSFVNVCAGAGAGCGVYSKGHVVSVVKIDEIGKCEIIPGEYSVCLCATSASSRSSNVPLKTIQ